MQYETTVPTVADRVAQTAVKQVIEPILDPIFLPDSYGYRPNKSALDAVGATRERCWKYDWVLEFDIKGLFDNIDHEFLLRAVRKHITCQWALLYIERWLKAPMVQEDGTTIERSRGTPQGGVATPLTQKVISSLRGCWLVGEVPLQYLTGALRGNMFMTDGPINQGGQGSAVERRFQHASEQRCVPRGHAAIVAGVRFVRTSGIPVLGGSDTTEATCRGHRGYSADHPQGSRGNSASSSGLFEKYWAHHRSHRDTGIGHVSEQTEKTWLSRAQRPAPFKFTLSIFLTACTIRSSPKPTVF